MDKKKSTEINNSKKVYLPQAFTAGWWVKVFVLVSVVSQSVLLY